MSRNMSKLFFFRVPVSVVILIVPNTIFNIDWHSESDAQCRKKKQIHKCKCMGHTHPTTSGLPMDFDSVSHTNHLFDSVPSIRWCWIPFEPRYQWMTTTTSTTKKKSEEKKSREMRERANRWHLFPVVGFAGSRRQPWWTILITHHCGSPANKHYYLSSSIRLFIDCVVAVYWIKFEWNEIIFFFVPFSFLFVVWFTIFLRYFMCLH